MKKTSAKNSRKPKQKKERLFPKLIRIMKADKIGFSIYCILCVFCIFIIIGSIFRGNRIGILNGFLALLLFFLPAFLEDSLKIKFSTVLEVLVMLFIFCAQILGEVKMYYTKFPFWDNMLHWTNGFLFAAFGFSLADLCNRSKKISFKLSPFFLALVACCFSLSIGVLWEFVEFFTDYFTKSDMQKDMIINWISSGKLSPNGQTPVVIKNIANTVITAADGTTYVVEGGYLDIGLWDTMKDLMVDFTGAFIFSVIGYFHVKYRGKFRLAKVLIPEVLPIPDKDGNNRQNEPTGTGCAKAVDSDHPVTDQSAEAVGPDIPAADQSAEAAGPDSSATNQSAEAAGPDSSATDQSADAEEKTKGTDQH